MAIAVKQPPGVVGAGSTLAALQEQVARFVRKPDEPRVVLEAGDAINNAIDLLNQKNWNCSVREARINWAIGQELYPLESRFKAVAYLWLLNSDKQFMRELDYLPPSALSSQMKANDKEQTPQYYTVHRYASQWRLRLDARPVSNWTSDYTWGYLYFFALQPHLNGAGQILDVPEFVPFVKAHAKWELALTHAPEIARSAREMASTAWGGLTNQDEEFVLSRGD